MLQPGWAGLATPLSQIQHANFSTLRHDTVTQREAIKIARHLRFGAATPPLAFPARLTGLPGQWRIRRTSALRRREGTAARPARGDGMLTMHDRSTPERAHDNQTPCDATFGMKARTVAPTLTG
jgi:hypothetical protein